MIYGFSITMSYPNWWQQGRGIGQVGRGYPRYAGPIYSQGNEYQSHLTNWLRNGSFYGEQGHGFYGYYPGNEYLQPHPANRQWNGFLNGETGHGFGYAGDERQMHLANSQRGGFFHGGQGRGFGYLGNEFQSHPANSQRDVPFYRERGRGLGHLENEQEFQSTNNQRGGVVFNRKRGHGFSSTNNRRGGFNNRERGRGFSPIGNEGESHSTNNQRGSSNNRERGRGFSPVGNEGESHSTNNQRGSSNNRERGRGVSPVGNEGESHSTNNQRGSSNNRERGRGFSPVGNEGESHSTNNQRGSSNNRERGRGFNPVENEGESHSTNNQRGSSNNRERGRGFSPVGNEGESHSTNNRSSRGGSNKRERGLGSRPVGNKGESHSTKNQRGSFNNIERGRSFSSVGSDCRSHSTKNQRGSFNNIERGRSFSPVGSDCRSHSTKNKRDGWNKKERERGVSPGGKEDESHSYSQRGGSTKRELGRGSSQIGNNDESHPTSSQKDGFVGKDRGRGLSQRGRGQHHKGDRMYHRSHETSNDAGSAYTAHKESWRSGKTTSKPTSISDFVPHKKKEPTSEVLPQPKPKYLDFPFIEDDETVRLLPQFRVMFILRGLPGSGKTTIADVILKQCEDHAIVCSANYYHYNEDGKYVWRKDALQETHSKCQKRAEKYATLNKPVIVIDNTNVKQSEMEPYTKLAKEHGYVVVLIEPKTPWKLQASELATKNVHNVPFSTISRRLEQYDEVLPHYFGWFVSQTESEKLQAMAEDILSKCLQITDFQQSIQTFSGHPYADFTVQNALSYYSIKHSGRQVFYHVTACFSPRGKYLAGSPYHKSPAVGKALGEVSHLSIIGYVITNDTFSARVSLTKKQRALWMNDNETEQQRGKRGHATRHDHSVEKMTKSFQHLPLDNHGKSLEQPDHCTSASTHITLGTKRDISPVQAKYDVQTVVNYELSSHVFEEHALQGDIGKVRKYSDSIWAVYFNEEHLVKIPAIFSGYYD